MTSRHVIPYPFPMTYEQGVGDTLFKLDFDREEGMAHIEVVVSSWVSQREDYPEEQSYFAGATAALYGVDLSGVQS